MAEQTPTTNAAPTAATPAPVNPDIGKHVADITRNEAVLPFTLHEKRGGPSGKGAGELYPFVEKKLFFAKENFPNIIKFLADEAPNMLYVALRKVCQDAAYECTDDETGALDLPKFQTYIIDMAATSETIGELQDKQKELVADLITMPRVTPDDFAAITEKLGEIQRNTVAIEKKSRPSRKAKTDVAPVTAEVAPS